jgi:AcrR family transcriptional regulator
LYALDSTTIDLCLLLFPWAKFRQRKAYYPDKDALLQAMTDVRFRDLIERRGISFTDCDGALRAIALGVCDYLAETTRCPGRLSRMPFEGSIIPVEEGMFKEGLARHEMVAGVDQQGRVCRGVSRMITNMCTPCYI